MHLNLAVFGHQLHGSLLCIPSAPVLKASNVVLLVLVRAGTAQTLLQLCTMSGLYPVREASEEDMHFSTDDVDVLDLLQDTSGIISRQPYLNAHCAVSRTLCMYFLCQSSL